MKSLRPDKTNRLRVIILCVFAATTFWFLNALNENYSTTLKYPLQFVYDKEKYIAIEELPENIQVNVSGLGWNLFRNSLGIKVTPLRIVLESPSELKKITGGALPALISDQISEVELNYVLTDTLHINIDRKTTRTFPVKIDSTAISLASGYRVVNSIRYTPDSVTLEGPDGILTQMPDTLLVSIPQKDIDENFKEDVPVNTPNNNLIKRNPPTLNIVFGVEEFIQTSESTPLKTVNFPENGKAYIEKNTINIGFLVSQSKREEVTSEDFEAVVDYNDINKTDSTIAPKLVKYPGYIQEVSLDTTRVKVRFNEE
ncbi:hypothetical protein LVD17_08430 [Fulvivirga ulvae]|uniref:hypothetical protein n=1 Tax=Fulvivirga ulvae TaxID=2904245 RepID=UPI001F4666C2|nr:hypothetical protein [Fulvivirga ulvae]UII33839.1 hypothetical protein LVD17_08430 [Fulvivirga ulvae]